MCIRSACVWIILGSLLMIPVNGFTGPVTLDYSTYLGGSLADTGNGIAVDGERNVYVTGSTYSADFPTLNAYGKTIIGGFDSVFVTKIDPSGTSLVYSTYIDGSGRDSGLQISVDGSGNAYVIGSTNSFNFPTFNAFQKSMVGLGDAFILKLNDSGSALIFSTYLGGNSNESGVDLAIDSFGNIHATGLTQSTDFPTLNAFRKLKSGMFDIDGFVTKLSPAGTSLLYSTYLGGSAFDIGVSIVVDDSGYACVTGETGSTDFPTVNAVQGMNRSTTGTQDAFVIKFNPDGLSAVFSTYLGGTGDDSGEGIAVDASGNVYATGKTPSANFPTLNAFQKMPGGGLDAYLVKLNNTGTPLLYSTFLGGSSDDMGNNLTASPSGKVYIAGETSSADFPTINAYQTSLNLNVDCFITMVDGSGSLLEFSTYLGGGTDDKAHDITIDDAGDTYITGETNSPDFPTIKPFQKFTSGDVDVCIAKLGLPVVPPTATPTHTYTLTPTHTFTFTPTQTFSPTRTPTGTPVLTPTHTFTLSPTDTFPFTPTGIPTRTPTGIPTITHTSPDSPTPTLTAGTTATHTNTPAVIPATSNPVLRFIIMGVLTGIVLLSMFKINRQVQ